jgi:uncharacterized protein YdcH (DUF465 family)
MNGQSPNAEHVPETDEEFHSLSTQHRQLDDRLHEIASKPHPSDDEQLEEVKLKKQKLHLKDRMEDILRRQRDNTQTAAG